MNNLVTQQVNLPTTVDELAKFVLIGREKLASVRAEMRAIDKLELAGDVREQKKQEATMLAGALLDAEVRIGQLTSEIPKSSGGDRKSDNFKNDSTNAFDKQSKSEHEVVKQLGERNIQRFQQMAEHPDIIEQVKAEAIENDDLPTRTEVLRRIKENNRKDVIDKQKADIEAGHSLPDGKFEVIVIDPPWQYGTEFDPNSRRVANPYPEMSIEEISNIEIPANDDCVMWLWTTHKFLPDSFELLKKWGFEYKATMVWNKQKMGIGYWLRMQCEFCLLAIKGNPVWDNRSITDILLEKRREHSRKPETFYQVVETLCVGRKLDFFSREKREGWYQYGNDTNKF